MDYKDKLTALLEGLDVENVSEFLEQPVEAFRVLGEAIDCELISAQGKLETIGDVLEEDWCEHGGECLVNDKDIVH